MRQGEEGDHLFVLEEGRLEVSIHGRTTNDMLPGDAFGCVALLYNVPRTATVSAKEDATGLWGLQGGYFRSLVRQHAERHQARNLKLLERIHILDGLSNLQKVNVGAVALLEETFGNQHLLACQGEECRRLYVVKSGALHLVAGGERDGTNWLGGDVLKEALAYVLLLFLLARWVWAASSERITCGSTPHIPSRHPQTGRRHTYHCIRYYIYNYIIIDVITIYRYILIYHHI